MTQKRRAHATLLLTAILAVACGGSESGSHDAGPATSPTAGLPTHLLPDHAVALLVVPAPEALRSAALELAGLFSDEPPPFPTDLTGLLGLLGAAGDLSQLDLERPLAVALVMRDVPTPAFLLPVRDGKAFQAGAGGAPVHLAEGYALVGAEPGKGQGTASAGMPGGLISLRLDLETIGPIIAPFIQSGLAGADPGETAGMDPAALLETLGDFASDFIASARTFDLGLDWDEGVLSLDGRLALVEGSPFAGWIVDRPTGATELAGALEPGASMSFVGGFEPQVMREQVLPWIARLFEMYPEALREALANSVAQMEAHYDHMGRAFAGTQDFGPDGLSYTYLLAPDDPEAFMAAMIEMFESPGFDALGYRVGEATRSEQDGVKLVTLPLAFDLAVLAEMVGESIPEEERADLEQALGGMFGEDMTLTVGARGKRVAMQVGAGDGVLKTLARAEAGGAPPPHLAPLLAAHGQANPLLVGHVDLARLMGGLLGAMGPMAAEQELPQIPADAQVDLSFYAAGQGTDARFGLRFDIAGLAQLVKAMGR